MFDPVLFLFRFADGQLDRLDAQIIAHRYTHPKAGTPAIAKAVGRPRRTVRRRIHRHGQLFRAKTATKD